MIYGEIHTLHKKVKDISQYLDLNTKIKGHFTKQHKTSRKFKISLTFLCSVYRETATNNVQLKKDLWLVSQKGGVLANVNIKH